jgi:hypothetical protein
MVSCCPSTAANFARPGLVSGGPAVRDRKSSSRIGARRSDDDCRCPRRPYNVPPDRYLFVTQSLLGHNRGIPSPDFDPNGCGPPVSNRRAHYRCLAHPNHLYLKAFNGRHIGSRAPICKGGPSLRKIEAPSGWSGTFRGVPPLDTHQDTIRHSGTMCGSHSRFRH